MSVKRKQRLKRLNKVYSVVSSEPNYISSCYLYTGERRTVYVLHIMKMNFTGTEKAADEQNK